MKPKLKLLGKNGNVFAILGTAQKVALENDMDWKSIQEEAITGDYDKVLQTMMKYFDVQ